MTDPSKHIWACLHDEMNAEEKEFFRQALADDAKLRETTEHCKATHRVLGSLLADLTLPEPNEGDEAVEDRLIAEWEAEHPEYAEAPRRKPGRILMFTAPLAAAAALFVILTLPRQTGPVLWQNTAFGTAPQLRGEPAIRAHYSRNDLKEFDRALRHSIETACLQQDSESGPWKLQISLQELAGGALSVEVSGHPLADPGASNHWNENFQEADTFRAELPTFGKQIADELTGSSN